MALTAGLLLGAAMRPQLIDADGPAGPQMLAGVSGVRASTPLDEGLAEASYAAGVPDYVVGTDWRKPLAAPPQPDPYPADLDMRYDAPPEREAPVEPEAKVGAATPAIYTASASDHLSYPSLDGGAAYEDASRAGRTPPADLDDEAPPEAAGDTAIER